MAKYLIEFTPYGSENGPRSTQVIADGIVIDEHGNWQFVNMQEDDKPHKITAMFNPSIVSFVKKLED